MKCTLQTSPTDRLVCSHFENKLHCLHPNVNHPVAGKEEKKGFFVALFIGLNGKILRIKDSLQAW